MADIDGFDYHLPWGCKKRLAMIMFWRCKMGSTGFLKYLRLSVVCLLFVFLTNTTRADTVRVGIPRATFEALGSLLELPPVAPFLMSAGDCPPLHADLLKSAGRAVIEAVIVCNAVFEADLADRIELIHHLPHKRRLNEIAEGRLDVSGDTVFPEVLDTLSAVTRPLLSDALIRANEFEKGVFTIPGREDVLAVRTLEELRNFKAVIVKFWVVDVKTLDAMNLKRVVGVTKPGLYAKFMKAGRADFTISEFSSVANKPWAREMARVPGVKISLISPRVIPVSPRRDDILRALNGFIERSRSGEEDAIRRAFLDAGFMRPEFSDWKRLFPVE